MLEFPCYSHGIVSCRRLALCVALVWWQARQAARGDIQRTS